jgi:hypothetical protein
MRSRRCNEVPVSFSEKNSACKACAWMALAWGAESLQLKKGQSIWDDLRAGESWKSGKRPHEAIQKSVFKCEMMIDAFFLQVEKPLMGVRKGVLGLWKRAYHTVSACCRTTVGDKLKKVLATR